MPSKFLSNGILRDVLFKATREEKQSLAKLLDEDQGFALNNNKIQEQICECGGHGVANFFRGQGTGYLDILDDVADKLEINGLTSYYVAGENGLSVSEFDEIESLKTTRRNAIEM